MNGKDQIDNIRESVKQLKIHSLQYNKIKKIILGLTLPAKKTFTGIVKANKTITVTEPVTNKEYGFGYNRAIDDCQVVVDELKALVKEDYDQ